MCIGGFSINMFDCEHKHVFNVEWFCSFGSITGFSVACNCVSKLYFSDRFYGMLHNDWNWKGMLQPLFKECYTTIEIEKAWRDILPFVFFGGQYYTAEGTD